MIGGKGRNKTYPTASAQAGLVVRSSTRVVDPLLELSSLSLDRGRSDKRKEGEEGEDLCEHFVDVFFWVWWVGADKQKVVGCGVAGEENLVDE